MPARGEGKQLSGGAQRERAISNRISDPDGNKNDKGVWGAFWGFEIYTREYIKAQKESLIVMERGGKGNRGFELIPKNGSSRIHPEPEQTRYEKTQADI